ncbi:MAG: serine/threonine protein kinase [Planctomycetia bacterium]|nr:serine/threonine protein kinase [Planctomycetia bacterium]
MPVDTAATLLDLLRQTQLLTASQLDAVEQELLRRFPDPKALARELVQRDWLTPYQANQLLQGAAGNLVLGPYGILERLGENALGQVFKARHQLMNRLVTLTIVREELLSQPQAVERFYQEIQAASQLSEPHIVHPYDAGPIGRSHFFAQEFVDGIDLERLVQQSGPLNIATASSYIGQTALALQHAWQRGLLHHDLRPANLLVSRPPTSSAAISIAAKTPLPSSDQLRQGTIKVSNLGLTLLQPRLRSASAGGAAANADFIAPEQAQGQPLDVRANLYSLGCIFYYLVAGQAPFAGSSSSVKLRQHQTDEPKPLTERRPELPPHLDQVIRKLLAKRPEDRYQSPQELTAELAPGLAARLTLQASLSQPVPSATTIAPPPATPRSWRWPLLAAGVIAVLVVLMLLVWLLRGRGAGAVEDRSAGVAAGAGFARYAKQATREATILATLQQNGYPTLDGKWYYIGPFANHERNGFAAVYPPEQEIDLAKSYPGKGNKSVAWKELPNFRLGQLYDIKQVIHQDNATVYLLHEFEAPQASSLEVGLGSDDTLSVWLNGQQLLAKDIYRGAAPDQDLVTLPVRAGHNQLLLKVCQGTGDWKFYVQPRWPDHLEKNFASSLERDFPNRPTR